MVFSVEELFLSSAGNFFLKSPNQTQQPILLRTLFMPARRRQIVAGKLYELEIRARSGIPFPCLRLIHLLLSSALARTQRDSKVTICHFLWMTNHLHMLLVAKDAELCAQFYSELMKKITDYLKRLLALDHLELWERGGPVLSEVLDLNAAINRMVYLYANPSRADFVSSVADYHGCSSWSSFATAPEKDSHTEMVPWIRQPTIPTLPSRTLSNSQDLKITQLLRERNSSLHPLTVNPHALYAVFGVTDKDEIAELNRSFFAQLEERERAHANTRGSKPVMGMNRLRNIPIMRPHTPKRTPNERKILFHTTSKELALAFLEQFHCFCALCREAYLQWRNGNFLASWPPGGFRPSMRPTANAIG